MRVFAVFLYVLPWLLGILFRGLLTIHPDPYCPNEWRGQEDK